VQLEKSAKTKKSNKVKQLKTFKVISIISYLLIFLMGQMIGIPFFWFLLLALMDFGSIDQLFAFFAVIGLTISFITMDSPRKSKVLLLDILSFALLSSAIVRRLTTVPIELFNFLAFILPTIVFVVFYIVSLYFSVRQYFKIQKTYV
jgi:hypothetical protein